MTRFHTTRISKLLFVALLISMLSLLTPAQAAESEALLCMGLKDNLGYPVNPLITFPGFEVCGADGFMHTCSGLGWLPSTERCGSPFGRTKVWYVDDRPGGPGDGSLLNPFRKVQDGLDAARDGDRVFIFNGQYKAEPRTYLDPTCGNCSEDSELPTVFHVPLGFYAAGKSLIVEGQSRDGVVLHTLAQYGFMFEHAGTSLIRNLTLTGGKRGFDASTTDAALLARYSNLLVKNVKITKNLEIVGFPSPYWDVGIVGIAGREGSALTIQDSVIQENSWDGIALYKSDYLGNRATAIIEDNVISDGPNGRGAGIGLTWDSVGLIRRNEIFNYVKGVIAVGDSISDVSNNIIRDGSGWAFGIHGNADIDIVNNVMTNFNHFGAMIIGGGASVTLRNNIFHEIPVAVGEIYSERPGLFYNDFHGNGMDLGECTNSSHTTCTPRSFEPGDVDNLTLDPEFTNPSGNDFTLACTSPVRDMGDPSELYNDLDGSRNDMGAYGGPRSSQAPGCALLETLTVPADGTVIQTKGSYPATQVFRIEVEGTYVWGGCDPINCPGGNSCGYLRYGDARHLTDDCWATNYTLGGLSIYVDGFSVNWGSYDDSHTYSIDRIGNGGPFSFHINDCPTCYGDNSGSLTVRIYADE